MVTLRGDPEDVERAEGLSWPKTEQEICINLLTPRGNRCEIGVLPRPVPDPSPRHRAFEVLIKENCRVGLAIGPSVATIGRSEIRR